MLELVAPDLGAVVVEDHAPRAGGALVDGGYELGQFLLPPDGDSNRPSWPTWLIRSPTLTACRAAARTPPASTGCCRPIDRNISTATPTADDKAKRSVIRALEWTGEFFGNTERFARIVLDEVADVPDPKILELARAMAGCPASCSNGIPRPSSR